MLFVGTFENYKLDSKGRLSLPIRWRERLGKEFYISASTVRGCKCITLYPIEEYEKEYQRLKKGNENEMYLIRKEFFRNTEECSLDSQGRFTLNQRLKEKALLENDMDIIFLGNGETIEIWNQEEYDKIESGFDDNLGLLDLADRVNGASKAQEQE